MGNCVVESLSSDKGYAMINGGRYSFYRVHRHSPYEKTGDGIPEMKGTHPYSGSALGLNTNHLLPEAAMMTTGTTSRVVFVLLGRT